VHAHPLELFAADLVPFTAGFALFRPHIFFVFLWIVGAALGTQTHHSGYRLPWIAAFDEQPDFHDFHHQRFSCCYGNIGWLDALHGTARPYREAQAAAEARRDKAQARWEEEREAREAREEREARREQQCRASATKAAEADVGEEDEEAGARLSTAGPRVCEKSRCEQAAAGAKRRAAARVARPLNWPLSTALSTAVGLHSPLEHG